MIDGYSPTNTSCAHGPCPGKTSLQSCCLLCLDSSTILYTNLATKSPACSRSCPTILSPSSTFSAQTPLSSSSIVSSFAQLLKLQLMLLSASSASGRRPQRSCQKKQHQDHLRHCQEPRLVQQDFTLYAVYKEYELCHGQMWSWMQALYLLYRHP